VNHKPIKEYLRDMPKEFKAAPADRSLQWRNKPAASDAQWPWQAILPTLRAGSRIAPQLISSIRTARRKRPQDEPFSRTTP
jgi:hypothetical protein